MSCLFPSLKKFAKLEYQYRKLSGLTLTLISNFKVTSIAKQDSQHSEFDENTFCIKGQDLIFMIGNEKVSK